eukprot:GILI01010323.1.p1 GENE.GILI01010323.1~~GILI01010323.1.p1  ORF type:complete len:198 (-),score=48.72 GILI01010323.1:97-690(-)
MRAILFIAILVAVCAATVAMAHPGGHPGHTHGRKRGGSAPSDKQIAYFKRSGAKFLKDKEALEGVYKLESGLLFKVLTKGTGVKSPTLNDDCEVHYAGTLRDGTKFDSSIDRGQPATFKPNQVIKGWTEALQLMREGDKWEVYIPYYLAYGENGRPPKIPGYSPLVFTMELVKIDGPSQDVSEDVFQKNFGKDYSEL